MKNIYYEDTVAFLSEPPWNQNSLLPSQDDEVMQCVLPSGLIKETSL